MKFFFAVFVLLMVVSCGSIAPEGSYYDFRDNMTDDEVMAYYNAEGLCKLKGIHVRLKGNWAAGDYGNWEQTLERLHNLIEMKDFFTAEEMSLIKDQKIQTDMREMAAYCSWGFPIDQNDTVTRYGRHRQSVMGGGVYLYFEDGLLTSWQK